MLIGVPTETCPGETRVAIVPGAIKPLRKASHDVLIQSGAGDRAGYSDDEYIKEGARIGARADALAADILCQVRALGANPSAGREDLASLHRDQVVIGLCDPLGEPALARELAVRGVRAHALELMPRTTRAQSMDVLSSQAMVAGYRAVILAAETLDRLFPMMMTAAGTIAAARVLVIGAGVAGLQAIATARRLGAVVTAYDIRPAVKEEVQSVGGRFLELNLPSGDAQDKGGYARAMDEAFYKAQRELMGEAVAASNIVISTAAVPGRKSPVLVTAEHARTMPRGSVIVDLAAERGGNCELTRPDQTVHDSGVTILGPTNLPASAPYHASQLFARNVASFIAHMTKDGTWRTDPADTASDEIATATLLTAGGEVVHARVRELPGAAP